MKFTKGEIQKVGEILKDRSSFTNEDIFKAEEMLTEYRIAHAPIINTFQANLRLKLKNLKIKGLVAQRLKRQSSIISKLVRENNMNLARMQDIAGVRVIFKNLKELYLFKNQYVKCRFKHELVKETDYIVNPKRSGYRGIHLIYKFHQPDLESSHGLKIEIQLRTKLQHTWATTVETMGTFIDYSLKSSQGPSDILNFFALTSSAFALIEERPVLEIHKHLTESEIFQNVISEFERLGIESKLAGYTVAADHITKSKISAKYFLIILNFADRRVKVHSFKKRQLKEANQEYTEIEREISKGAQVQAVLISLESIDTLRKAYPNYFLDTREFIKIIEQIRTKVKNTVPNIV